MKDNSKKEAYVKEFQEKLEKSAVVVLAGCEGVKVSEMTELRRAVRDTNSEIRVVKNTLLIRALKNANMGDLEPHMKGATAVTFGYEDPVSPVKALFDFAGKAKKFQFKAGFLEGSTLNADQLKALSTMPGRQELLGMVASCMQGPIRNIVSVCQAPIRKMVYALDAIREKKEKQAA